MLPKLILMAKTKHNLNLKIQMLAGKDAQELFERTKDNLRSLAHIGLILCQN